MAESAQVRIAKIDVATTREAGELAALGEKIEAEVAKLDAYRADLQGMFERMAAGGNPHATLQMIADVTNVIGASVAALKEAAAPIADQVTRLTEMGRDPANPVPPTAA
jgi:hypothetical protein